MKKIFSAVLGGCLLLGACAATEQKTITIKGKVQFPDNSFNMEIVERNGFDKTIIDSCKVNEDGTYRFTMKVDRPGVYTLDCQKWQSVQFWAEDEDLEIYTSGATNILKYPELADKSNAAQILSAFEEKKDLNEWIEQEPVGQNDDNHAIQVYIGGETQVESMKDCSLVTATYRIDDGVYGKVGIVGPKRMDYDKVVATLQSMMEQLDDIFKDKK